MRKIRPKKQGKLIPNGVRPEPQEMDTILFFTNIGKKLELIPPSNTPHSRRPDFLMDGAEWEAKSPLASTRRALERIFYNASHQSNNIVIDLRRIRCGDVVAVSILEKCFSTTRRVRRMYIITQTGELKHYQK